MIFFTVWLNASPEEVPLKLPIPMPKIARKTKSCLLMMQSMIGSKCYSLCYDICSKYLLKVEQETVNFIVILFFLFNVTANDYVIINGTSNVIINGTSKHHPTFRKYNLIILAFVMSIHVFEFRKSQMFHDIRVVCSCLLCVLKSFFWFMCWQWYTVCSFDAPFKFIAS
jgi:hypothetical protein